ncbi:hypothetical protein BDB00DRAFT_36474 [Zychaea mexicana]|uniref:uncharacterized protein n=1 Tax=Zychaea mexicana TaxID=64656 RepID=UPI0022FDFDD0|nr:uncharacterized protein BDB00DRAFT_36474 [Zychaea mexicana]KAI9488591.1 hypothetical protein BDB00DRAFT_36474 [Zychaea mexicana]
MDLTKTSPPRHQQHQHSESRLDILRGAISRYSHIINTDTKNHWRKLKTQNLPRSSRIHVHKRSGGASEIYKIEVDITARADRTWTLSSWHALFQSVGTRKLWDQMMDEVQVLDRPDSNTVITHRTFKGSSNEGCVFAERTIRKPSMIRHIVTTTTPHQDDNEQYAAACPALAGYDVRISPEDDPNLDSRVTFYYEIVSPTLSEDVLEPYVLSLVTGPLSTLALHGAPPDILREPDSFVKSLVYNPDRRTWDLVYQVSNAASSIGQHQHHPSSSSSFATASGGKVGSGGGGSEPASPSSAVGSISIQPPRKGSLASSSMHWQGGTGSWDRSNTSPLQLASSLRHRRGSFMGPLLLPPSSSLSSIHSRGFHKASTAISPTISPSSPQQKRVLFSSSYTFGRNDDTKSNRGMEWGRTPDLVVELDSKTWAGRSAAAVDLQLEVSVAGMGELDSKMVDQFAQLCIRCYAERQPPPDDDSYYRYFVTLYHPPQLIQYLIKENEESAANLAREPVTGPRDEINVNLRLTPRKRSSGNDDIGEEDAQQSDNMDFALFVNGKEWPFRSWVGESLFFDENSSGTSSEEDEDVDVDIDIGDHDVFVDDMEDGDVNENFVATKEMTPSIELEPVAVSRSDQIVSTSSLLGENQGSSTASSKEYAATEEQKTEHYDTIENAEQEEKQEQMEPRMSKEGEADDVMDIPKTDPEPVLRMRNYFERLIRSEKWNMVQAPEPSNLFVTIRKLEVPGHPTGAYLSEAVWNDCSVWDVKAVVSCVGARKIWDSTYEDGVFLHQVSNTCTLWHHKMKGFWTVSPRDCVTFTSAYTSASCIDLCSTSCMNDSYDHHSLPTNTPGYVRARLDLWNWRIERIDGEATSVKLINQANLQGWIPSYVPNSLSGHNADLVMRAHQFFNKHGAPPDLTMLEHGSLVNVSYDHHRQSWRCEYTRWTEDSTSTSESSSTSAEVRIRRRLGRSYNVVIDPPPSSVKASTRTHDPYGIWLEISHQESDIIPQRGKILLLIKPGFDDDQEKVVINGDATAVDKDFVKSMRIKEKLVVKVDHGIESDSDEPPPQVMPRQASAAQAPITATGFIEDDEQRKAVSALGGEEKGVEKNITTIIESLPKSPEDLAQSALAFLTRVSDQQFGWSNVSDKNGLKVSKRPGTAKLTNSSTEKIMQMFMGEAMEIPEPSVIVKATKVIEGFSLEEVASIVTNTGNLRKQYDEAVEEIEVLARLRNGCQIVRQLVKGIFPFKSREIYVSACTAYEKAHLTTNPSAKRILYVEASIPNFPSSSDPSKRPPALFFLSGWILEAIDPYTTTTNHPIPSMRATCLASLDLGSSVPAYMSNLVTTGLPKRMKALEKLLHSQGPAPYLGHPYAAQVFSGGKLVDELSAQGPLEWTMVDITYDKDKYVFTCDASFRLLSSPSKKTIGNVPNKSNLSTSLVKSNRQQQGSVSTGSMTATTSSSTTMGSNSSVSSDISSSNATISTTSKIACGSTGRAGGGAVTTSIPPGETSASIATTTPPTATKSSTSSSSRSNDTNTSLLRAILDLRNYSKGYELNVNMNRRMSNSSNNATTTIAKNVLMTGGEEKDVSSMLSVNVSELAPEPSHLIANTNNNEVVPRKHAIEITAKTAMLAHDKVYALELQLIPVTEECLQKRETRLTVSGVLGEDDGQWHGIVMLNGQEMKVDSTVEVAASPIIESPVIHQSYHQLDQEDDPELLVTNQQQQQQQQQPYDEANASVEHNLDESVSVLGGGVVAAALGGVSASVNQIQDFRTRMFSPFRNSTSFLAGVSTADEDDFFESPASTPSESSIEGKDAFPMPTTGDDTATTATQHVQHRRSRHRSKSAPDSVTRRTASATVRRTTGTSTINKSGFLVMILLLLLILMATIRIPTKEEVLDTYTNATRLRQLWRIPWMSGWHIEIIAVQHQ